VNDGERASLLSVARNSIRAHLSGSPPPPVPPTAPAAAFVTLRVDKELRGCIGFTTAADPLAETVRDAAIRAATADSRFDPVRLEELDAVHIEISVLSPMTRARAEDVVVGTHGLYVRRAGHAGLLLPQVADEWKMDREAFLAAVCRKAELPPDAWRRPDAELSIFTAEVFGE